jgi:hypothetical protein
MKTPAVEQLELFSHDLAMLGTSGFERRPADCYETPEWVTEALLNKIKLRGYVWEPACGSGKMSKVIRAHSYECCETDIAFTPQEFIQPLDFLTTDLLHSPYPGETKTIMTNPPYNQAEAFIRHAIDLMRPVGGMVVMLLRNEYDCASRRNDLFSDPKSCFSEKYVITKRIRWIEGSKISPRHNFSWYKWDFLHNGEPGIRYLP